MITPKPRPERSIEVGGQPVEVSVTRIRLQSPDDKGRMGAFKNLKDGLSRHETRLVNSARTKG